MSELGSRVILGADIGGTSTRVVVAEVDDSGFGDVLGIATGGGGNPNAVGLERSARQIAGVAAAALDQAATVREPRPQVVSAVLGLAGYGAVVDPPSYLAAALPEVPTEAVRVVPDFAIAFASATPALAGYVVLAGTGAGAVEISNGAVTGRRDAWGWLLGDQGSGFWIGREAVRSTLAILESRRSPGPLARAVLAKTDTHDLESLVAHVYSVPPIRLAALAPTVSSTAAIDPEAYRIAERAAEMLMESLMGLEPVSSRPVVTTGSVLEHHATVRQTLLDAVRARLGSEVRHATSGLVGALWLGGPLRTETGPRAEAEHARLVRMVTDATPR